MNKAQKEYAVNLAEKINNGFLQVSYVLDIFEENKGAAEEITRFWLNFNHNTQLALNKVVTEYHRRHLERCFNLRDNPM